MDRLTATHAINNNLGGTIPKITYPHAINAPTQNWQIPITTNLGPTIASTKQDMQGTQKQTYAQSVNNLVPQIARSIPENISPVHISVKDYRIEKHDYCEYCIFNECFRKENMENDYPRLLAKQAALKFTKAVYGHLEVASFEHIMCHTDFSIGIAQRAFHYFIGNENLGHAWHEIPDHALRRSIPWR